MTHQEQSNALDSIVELLAEHGFEGMAQAIEILFNEAMKLRRSEALGPRPYQRTAEQRGHANGFKPKTVNSRLGTLELQVPQTRASSSILGAGARRTNERALKLAVAEMYVQGVSTRKVAAITQELCGLDVSSVRVSRAAALLDEELEAWRNRPLSEIPYLILDARYEKIRHAGRSFPARAGGDWYHSRWQTQRAGCERLALGGRGPLADFLASLQDRGLHGVRYIVSDDHAGLKQARQARFSGVPWQRCQFPLMQNAMHYVPKISMRVEVARDLRAVLDAGDRVEAERQLGLVIKNTPPRRPSSPAGSKPTSPKPSPYSSCLSRIAASCGPRTCSNGSTKKSNDAHESPPSSPTSKRHPTRQRRPRRNQRRMGNQ